MKGIVVIGDTVVARGRIELPFKDLQSFTLATMLSSQKNLKKYSYYPVLSKDWAKKNHPILGGFDSF